VVALAEGAVPGEVPVTKDRCTKSWYVECLACVDLRGSRPRCVWERGLNGTRLLHRCYAGVLLCSLFVPKQSRRTCPDLGEAKPGVSLPHLRKRSEWVALSRPGPEHVGPRFGPRGPSGEEEGYL
jgi:hypothetical protein